VLREVTKRASGGAAGRSSAKGTSSLLVVALVAVLGIVVAAIAGVVIFDSRNTSSAPSPGSGTGASPAAQQVTVTQTATVQATPAASPNETHSASPTGQPGDFSQTFNTVQSGVMRILATTCAGSGIGTGFLVNPRTLATAAHVIAGAESVAVDTASGTDPAHVIGVDPSADLALLRLPSPVVGHVFTFASSNPSPGTVVAAIGFPLNNPKTLTEGTVSGLDRTIRIDGFPRSGLLQTDTAINPGNSGGPLITSDGDVVGVVDALELNSQGIGYAVEVSAARPPLVDGIGLAAPTPPSCGVSHPPAQLSVAPRLLAPPGPAAAQIRRTLNTYYGSINSGDYAATISAFAPSFAAGFSPEQMARELNTSFDFSVVIHTVSGSTYQASAWVTFVSVQAPRYGPDGEGCTQWSLDYRFTNTTGRLLIAGVQPHNGGTGHAPC
jgi:serine protease Do